MMLLTPLLAGKSDNILETLGILLLKILAVGFVILYPGLICGAVYL
jgi:monovalent cation:H+ antiporter-2, CPA2 family